MKRKSPLPYEEIAVLEADIKEGLSAEFSN